MEIPKIMSSEQEQAGNNESPQAEEMVGVPSEQESAFEKPALSQLPKERQEKEAGQNLGGAFWIVILLITSLAIILVIIYKDDLYGKPEQVLDKGPKRTGDGPGLRSSKNIDFSVYDRQFAQTLRRLNKRAGDLVYCIDELTRLEDFLLSTTTLKNSGEEKKHAIVLHEAQKMLKTLKVKSNELGELRYQQIKKRVKNILKKRAYGNAIKALKRFPKELKYSLANDQVQKEIERIEKLADKHFAEILKTVEDLETQERYLEAIKKIREAVAFNIDSISKKVETELSRLEKLFLAKTNLDLKLLKSHGELIHKTTREIQDFLSKTKTSVQRYKYQEVLEKAEQLDKDLKKSLSFFSVESNEEIRRELLEAIRILKLLAGLKKEVLFSFHLKKGKSVTLKLRPAGEELWRKKVFASLEEPLKEVLANSFKGRPLQGKLSHVKGEVFLIKFLQKVSRTRKKEISLSLSLENLAHITYLKQAKDNKNISTLQWFYFFLVNENYALLKEQAALLNGTKNALAVSKILFGFEKKLAYRIQNISQGKVKALGQGRVVFFYSLKNKLDIDDWRLVRGTKQWKFDKFGARPTAWGLLRHEFFHPVGAKIEIKIQPLDVIDIKTDSKSPVWVAPLLKKIATVYKKRQKENKKAVVVDLTIVMEITKSGGKLSVDGELVWEGKDAMLASGALPFVTLSTDKIVFIESIQIKSFIEPLLKEVLKYEQNAKRK